MRNPFKVKEYPQITVKDVQSILPPAAIIDNFISEQERLQAEHHAEMERLQSIIADATARLANHTAAFNALADVLLGTLAVEQETATPVLQFRTT